MSGSGDPPVTDLRQATLSILIQRLAELADAIVTTNKRFLSLEERIVERLDLLEAGQKAMMRELRETRSEVIAQNNQIINLQHAALQFAHGEFRPPR